MGRNATPKVVLTGQPNILPIRRALFNAGHCSLVYRPVGTEADVCPDIPNRVATPETIARALAGEALPPSSQSSVRAASGIQASVEGPDLKDRIAQFRRSVNQCKIYGACRVSALRGHVRTGDGALSGYLHDHVCFPPIPLAERRLVGRCTQCDATIYGANPHDYRSHKAQHAKFCQRWCPELWWKEDQVPLLTGPTPELGESAEMFLGESVMSAELRFQGQARPRNSSSGASTRQLEASSLESDSSPGRFVSEQRASCKRLEFLRLPEGADLQHHSCSVHLARLQTMHRHELFAAKPSTIRRISSSEVGLCQQIFYGLVMGSRDPSVPQRGLSTDWGIFQSGVLGAVESDPERGQKGPGFAEAHRQLDTRCEMHLRLTYFKEGRFREFLSRAGARVWAGLHEPKFPPDDDQAGEIHARESSRLVRAGQTKHALQRLGHPGVGEPEQSIQTAVGSALGPDGKVDLPP